MQLRRWVDWKEMREENRVVRRFLWRSRYVELLYCLTKHASRLLVFRSSAVRPTRTGTWLWSKRCVYQFRRRRTWKWEQYPLHIQLAGMGSVVSFSSWVRGRSRPKTVFSVILYLQIASVGSSWQQILHQCPEKWGIVPSPKTGTGTPRTPVNYAYGSLGY